MGHWNYRVMRHDDTIGDAPNVWYAIHEVYYNDDGSVYLWTENAVALYGETVEQLRDEHTMWLEAFEQPILTWEEPPTEDIVSSFGLELETDV